MSKPVAIITGGASGIGLALTKHLLTKGYRVVMANVNTKAGTQLCAELGPDTLFHRTDVSSYAEQVELFKSAISWGGNRLDFFAANAGVDDRQNLFQSEEDLDENGDPKPLNLKTMEVDLDAVIQSVWLFKHYARKNANPGVKKIVITSSMAGFYSAPVNPQYCTAKAALVAFTRCVGPVLLNKENITVNAICPAFIATGLAPKAVLEVFPKEHLTPMSTALRAYNTFLADDSMTGQTVEVSLDQLYFRKQVEWANESQRWLGEEAPKVLWEKAYKTPPPRNDAL